jgi:hypothetical protein
VFVPVADQDRALEFDLGKLGFEKRGDFPHGEGSRWVEVAPPGSAIANALVPPGEGWTPGGDKTYCASSTDDIEADDETLRARGVEVDAEAARDTCSSAPTADGQHHRAAHALSSATSTGAGS